MRTDKLVFLGGSAAVGWELGSRWQGKKMRAHRWIGIVLGCLPLCGQPLLESMEPRGGQAGTAVHLVLTGKRLGPAPRLVSEAPLAATPLSGPPGESEATSNELAYLVEVGRDATLGTYPLRIETAEGLSNALLFTVGGFPQVAEHESAPDSDGEEVANDFPEIAQKINHPVTIGGRLQGPDRDLYRLQAKAGQNLVIEVAARRIGSAIDPHLELMDRNGRVLQRNGDAPGIGLDSRLAFHAEKDGDYIVSVRDERFSLQDADFYRLTVGDYSFASSVYPLGWTRGAALQAEFFGGNLSEPVRTAVSLAEAPQHAREAWVRVPGTPSSVLFQLGDEPEVLEADSGGQLSEGVVMNGRIAQSGEVDRYRLAVTSGEEWAFELRSGELPGSALYGVMTLSADNQILAVAGKHAGDPNPYVITTTRQTATYPFVNLAVPPGVSEITVTVEDLLDRGGPLFSYRLVARKQGPDFLLTLNEPYLNIPRAGSAVLNVTAERRGYYGPIELYVENAPDDLEVSGGHIAPTSRLDNTLPRFETGRLTLTARPGADLRRLDLVVRGRATAEGLGHLDRRAAGPAIRVPVQGTNQAAVDADWLGYDLPVRINPEQAARLEFEAPRRLRLVRGGQGQIAKWAYEPRRPGAQLAEKIDLPRNVGSLRLRRMEEGDSPDAGAFRMFTHERTSLGMVNFNLTAKVKIDGREETLYSKPLEVDIVDGYKIEPPSGDLEIGPGGTSDWTGSIWRDPEFRRVVKVSAVNLPAGMECEPAELPAEQTDFELRCKAATDAVEGEYEFEVRAESALSDEGTTPYLVEPVTGRVAIRR